jgi:peroxiredoxin Q/BCP
MLGFEAAMPQFEALGAQVVGVSTDPATALAAWQKQNNVGGKQILLSDFPRRQMLKAYGALETNEQSPIYHYAKRAYFIIDKTGTVKYIKIMDNALNLLDAGEVLKALKDSGAA